MYGRYRLGLPILKEFTFQKNIGVEKVGDIWWPLCKSNPPKMSKIAKLEDCVFLYQVVTHFKPKVIVEIGTWVGTTAYVMSQAQKDCVVNHSSFFHLFHFQLIFLTLVLKLLHVLFLVVQYLLAIFFVSLKVL